MHRAYTRGTTSATTTAGTCAVLGEMGTRVSVRLHMSRPLLLNTLASQYKVCTIPTALRGDVTAYAALGTD